MMEKTNHLPHLHKFEVRGDRFVLDIPNSRVYKINERMTQVIGLLQDGRTPGQIARDPGAPFPAEDIAGDLKTLEKLGLLAAKEKTFSPPETLPLNTLDLQVSHHCNLDCKYCYARGGSFGGEDKLMTAETAKKAVDFFIGQTDGKDKLCISFDGGEPLFNFDVIKEVARYGAEQAAKRDRRVFFNIGTNATVVDDDIAEFFAELKFSPQISLDGKKSIHDEIRPFKNGKGSYDALMKGIAKMQEKGVRVASRITITPRNLNLKDSVERLHNLGAIRIAAFPATGVPGEYVFGPEHLEPLKEEYDKTAEFFLDTLFNKGERVCFSNFTDNINALHKAKTLRYGCAAARTFVSVDPNEDIYPCHRLVGNRKYRLGNLLEGIDHRKRRVFLDNHADSKEKCRMCWAKYLCGGGCLVEADYANGDIKIPYDVSCEIFKYEKELSMMIYSKVLEKDKSLLKRIT